IGLNGFENPMRDPKTEEAKRHIGHGVKIKMDDAGNIIIKRASKNAVYAKDVNGPEDSCLSADIQRLQGQLEYEKPVKMFDMKKFQQHISRELRRAYPDRRKLETQCICVVGFVKDNTEVLDMPCWIMIINIVALDMLKSKLPPTVIRNRAMTDNDPYYCGLSARVPKFGKKMPAPQMPGLHTPLRKAHSESDGHTGSSEDDYSRIYGRLRQVPAHYGYYQRKELYASKWR
ncbi:dwarfin sma-2, partial [Trichonephila clavata]